MITNRVKNYLILGLLALLLISGGLNLYQSSLRKNDRIANELNLAKSNTIIAGNEAVIEQKQAAIESERKQRRLDSLYSAVKTTALNVKISKYEKRLATLPKTIPYSPDSAMVDNLRIAFSLKDSVIDTQKLKIANLSRDIDAQFESFGREIKDLQIQRAAQVENTNQLQIQLVDEQGKNRKSERWRKFWKRTTGAVIVTAAAVVTIVTLKE